MDAILMPAPFDAEAYAMDGDTVALVGVDYTVRVSGKGLWPE
jgi:hypothetical protein